MSHLQHRNAADADPGLNAGHDFCWNRLLEGIS